ncbi:MAG: YhcH/YjgK/YiaL family protein [Spirochaetales bacterium]|nr:YhcH/YjgK/YiaL family protein [Spirochaetales bacterium]
MYSLKNGLEFKYDLSEKKFRIAFDFLKRKDLAELPVGWIELGEGVRASVQRYDSFGWDENRFETHEKYFDVQYVIEGMEYCGVCKREELGPVAVAYDEANDIEFYEEPIHSGKVFLNAGDFIVLAPEDAHKPRCAVDKPMPIKKIVVKVPV